MPTPPRRPARSLRSLPAFLVLFGILLPVLDRDAAADVQRERISYEVRGVPCFAWKIWDDALPTPRPGVLLFHEFFGLEDFIVERGEALAEAGYVVFVADIYGMNLDGTNKVADTAEEAQALAVPLYQDRAEMGRRASSAYLQLTRMTEVDPGRIVAIGYGFGGTVALELGRSGPTVDGIIVLHGSLYTPDRSRNARIRGEVLVLRGGQDPFVTDEEVDEFVEDMTQARRRVTVTNYEWARHSFANSRSTSWALANIGYDEEAAEASEAAILSFLDRVVDGPAQGERRDEIEGG